MAFLSDTDLEEVLKKALGKQFDPNRVEQAAYELSLGGEAYLTDSDNKKPEILDDRNKTITINPGQFALLLAKETLLIPNDKLGLISIKASEKLKGLINVSGFHVDPGFNGQLLFSVYNAGPSSITLKKGNPYFLIWFADISIALKGKKAYNKEENHHQNQDGIPTIYMDALKNGVLASPNALSKQIENLSNNIETNKIRVNDYWVNLRWIARVAIGLLITLNLAIWLNQKIVDKAFKGELREKQIPSKIDKYLDSINIDSIVNNKIEKKVEKLKIKISDTILVSNKNDKSKK